MIITVFSPYSIKRIVCSLSRVKAVVQTFSHKHILVRLFKPANLHPFKCSLYILFKNNTIRLKNQSQDLFSNVKIPLFVNFEIFFSEFGLSTRPSNILYRLSREETSAWARIAAWYFSYMSTRPVGPAPLV